MTDQSFSTLRSALTDITQITITSEGVILIFADGTEILEKCVTVEEALEVVKAALE